MGVLLHPSIGVGIYVPSKRQFAFEYLKYMCLEYKLVLLCITDFTSKLNKLKQENLPETFSQKDDDVAVSVCMVNETYLRRFNLICLLIKFDII